MKGFLRLWAMCLRLVLTNPITWGLAACVLLGAWRGMFPAWSCPVAFAGTSVASLFFSVFLEGGGALREHIRLSQSQRFMLAAATAAAATFTLAAWAMCKVITQ